MLSSTSRKKVPWAYEPNEMDSTPSKHDVQYVYNSFRRRPVAKKPATPVVEKSARKCSTTYLVINDGVLDILDETGDILRIIIVVEERHHFVLLRDEIKGQFCVVKFSG